ncbi:hypothetical protein CQW36_04319 [Bacteroides fragilis]|nr:hypothetical protein CQW36_04319 [Bacteroides fragilis]
MIGSGKHARFVFSRSRKSSFFMSEQFRCSQFPWQRSAIHRYKRSVRTSAECMYLPCHPFLTRTRCATYQYGQTVCGGYQTHQLLKFHCRRTFADIKSLLRTFPFLLAFQQFTDNIKHFFRLYGFGQIIVGPFLHGFYGTGYIPVSCHDKKRHTIAMCFHPFE